MPIPPKIDPALQNIIRVPVDVVSDYSAWARSFKSPQACPEVSNDTNLWFAPGQIGKKPDFSGYIQIGGWSKPDIKSYDFK